MIGALDQGWGPRAGLLIGGVVTAVAGCVAGLRLAKAGNLAVQPQLRSQAARLRGWLDPAGH